MRRLFCLALAGLVGAAALFGASTKVWEISDRKDFLPGRFDGVQLDEEGRLLAAPSLTEAVALEESAVWAVAPAPDGGLYLGTGHEGRLYLVDAAGKATQIWDADELEIFALAAGDRGDVFAATSPGGKVYRVRRNGKAEEVFDPAQEYIWSLARQGKNLFVGTGPEGKVYRVGADGTGEEWAATGQRHVTSLAFDAEGRLLVGTDPNGLLYRVDGKGKLFTLYDADLPEIRSIVPGEDGRIDFAALGGAISLSDQTTQAVTQAATFQATATAAASGSSVSGIAPTPTVSPTMTYPTASQPAVSYGVETAAVYRLRPELAVEKLWSSKQENVLGLMRSPRDPSRLLLLTDQSSRLIEVESDARAVLVNQAPGRNAAGLFAVGGEALVSAVESAAVLRLGAKAVAAGKYVTAVRDAGGIAQWGRLSWKGDGKVRFSTRTGNSARPDGTWSDWSEEMASADGGLVASPAARYVQWRAELEPGAVIEQVRLAYLPQNRPPTIEALLVTTSAGGADDDASNGAGASAAYSITVSASADGSTSTSATSTEEQKLSGGVSRKLEVGWSATDPDEDQLVAEVEFRGEGETAWKTIKRDVTTSKATVERDALADGRYRFRVRVSDERSNPPQRARTAERVSEPILLDRTPPVVRLMERDGRRVARFAVEDAASAITRAEVSVDAGAWRPVFSVDGLLDSQEEEFEVDLSGLEPGERLVTLRVRDAAGNAGLAKVVVQ